ncbi:helix-turn-helix domain-containing protein [Dactylosporangium fulvum]
MAKANSVPDGGKSTAKLVASLVDLGFSQYEGRTYAGLVGQPPQTGYWVSKETQVPQPKVYETLGRLVERGAIVQVDDKPARFVAVPPQRLLAQMRAAFQHRIATAELEVSRLRATSSEARSVRPYWEADSWESIKETAESFIGDARERLHVSGHTEHLAQLKSTVHAADDRGVRIDILCFGEPPFELSNGFVVRHSSTDKIVYPHHQARHLALAADNEHALWALARDGEDWQAIWAENDNLLPALVKGFIRHDMYVQRTFGDFSEELIAMYGPGLEGMVNPHLKPMRAKKESGPNRRTA